MNDRTWRVGAGLKALIDIVAALVGLVVLAPVLFVVSLSILATSRGPILFRQVRIGRGGRPFRILKFRTMRANAELLLASDPMLLATYTSNDFKVPAGRDPRVTPVGRVLRKTSLDELPQLINVLTGRMSLVGPRPVVPDELPRYGDYRHLYLEVRPGITGPWQASGRSDLCYGDRIALDADYVARWSIWRDFAILLRTVPAVIGRRGAY